MIALLTFTPTMTFADPAADLVYGEEVGTGNTSIVLEDAIGTLFTIEVKIANATALMGASIGASWNASVLECDLDGPNSGFTGGQYLGSGPPPTSFLLTIPGSIDNSTGTINPYGYTRTDGGELAGSGTIALIDFEVVGFGSTTIALSVAIADSLGTEVTPAINNVTVVHTPPPPPPARRPNTDIDYIDPLNSAGQPPYTIFNETAVDFYMVLDEMAYDNITDTYYGVDFVEWEFKHAVAMYTVTYNTTTLDTTFTFEITGSWEVKVRSVALGMATNWPALQWSYNDWFPNILIVLPPTGALIDVYTETERAYGYTTPWIGEGQDVCADAYTIDEEVSLFANVTYNGGELQSRLVAWEVYDPHGNIVLTRTTMTDENGTATLDFRILTVCMNASYAVGTWWVIAKTSVGEVIINDTLCFKVYYLIAPGNTGVGSPIIVILTPSVPRGGMAVGDLALEHWASIPQNFTVAVTIYDELNVPVGYYTTTMEFPAAPNPTEEGYCNRRVIKRRPWFIEIPKWAYVGTGTVYLNMYTKPIADCGVAWAPEVSGPISIEV
jgi:hypothetical protein